MDSTALSIRSTVRTGGVGRRGESSSTRVACDAENVSTHGTRAARAGAIEIGPDARERDTEAHPALVQEGIGTTRDRTWYRESSTASWPRDLVRLREHLERSR